MTSFSKFLYSDCYVLNIFIIMKNFLLIIFGIITVFFVSNNYTQAINLGDFTPALDKKVASLKTTEEKVKYLKSFSDSLNTTKYTKSKDAQVYKKLREYAINMLNVFEYELKENQTKDNSKNQTLSNKSSTKNTAATQKKSKSDLPHLSDNLSNIDVQKVRDAVLSRHNEERYNVWVNPYTYDLDLEWSATTWVNNLVESGKTKNLHMRNSRDWYYNYNSLLNWFSDLWINFPKSAWTAASFSESIWRNVYKCSKSDCTQELINAVKKTRTWLIMKEKSSNGSHYRAAVMKHFTQMWIWIALDKANNRYYIVLHYGVDF